MPVKSTSEKPGLPPNFNKLTLSDKDLINGFLKAEKQVVSEFTFTNLFMWRNHYQTAWRVLNDCLLIVLRSLDNENFYGFPPFGKGNRQQAAHDLMTELEKSGNQPRILRADREFVENCLDLERYAAEPDPDQADYVYLAEELAQLRGRRFHKKKNLVNKFYRSNEYEYLELNQDIVSQVLEMQEKWCDLRHCELDAGLLHEDQGIGDLLENYGKLDCKGGVIRIKGRVQAFSLGELLNPTTAVIHVEKANPEITGLYAAMNQLFVARSMSGVEFVNREQDLGRESLRKAKKSYNPHHMVEKFDIRPLD